VNCNEARSASSARLDGELPAAEQPALDRHLSGCDACRRWADDAVGITRRVRLRTAQMPGPDLTGRVLSGTPKSSVAWPACRWLLLLVGVTMLLAALPSALGGHDGHLLREVAITEIALAVGVLSAAWQPWRAAGVLPVVLVLAAGLTITSAVDVLSGHVAPVDEAVHLLAPAAAVLLWRLRRRTPARPGTPPLRRLGVVEDDDRRSA
jgi:predicted anti-sigma-YlaC factor YlaD